MQMQQMIYFELVARRKSMNKAAEELFVSQPNLSKAIASLEGELGIRVFERSNKGVELTKDGRKLYDHVRIILRQVDFMKGIKNKPDDGGRLTISSFPCFLNGAILRQYYETTKSHVEVDMLEAPLHEIVMNVSELVSEIGIVHIDSSQAKEMHQLFKQQNLEYHELGKDVLRVNVGGQSPFWGANSVSLKELKDSMIIRRKADYFSNLGHFLRVDNMNLLDINRMMFVSDNFSLLQMLQHRDAFRFGIGRETSALAGYGIDSLLLKEGELETSIGWCKRSHDELSDEATSFLKIMDLYMQKKDGYE